MKQIILTITAQAPLAIGQRKPGGSVSEAMDYIPGTVIRGAIAGQILRQTRQSPEAGDDFHKLFVDEQSTVFHNGYPAIAKLEDDAYELRPEVVSVLPATALSSKTDSGFKPRKAGVFDSLIDSYCAREHGLFYEPNDVTGDRVESFDGFYSKADNIYATHSINKRLLTRVGINRQRATAQDEMLYSLEVLNESQGKQTPVPSVYRSAIVVNDDTVAEQLLAFIQANGDRMRLGGSASRGLGQVSLEASLGEVNADPLPQRIEAFNTKLQERWALWNAFGMPDPDPLKDRLFFTIDLQAAAIFTENWRRTMVLSATMLGQFIGISLDDIKLEMAYSSYDYRSGWNAAWGLPKDVELVTKSGGVFLYSIPKSESDHWYEPLAKLERWGVGDRANEGFGQIRVCDEFHQVMREASV
jgi:CRISPR-associated protein Csx10